MPSGRGGGDSPKCYRDKGTSSVLLWRAGTPRIDPERGGAKYTHGGCTSTHLNMEPWKREEPWIPVERGGAMDFHGSYGTRAEAKYTYEEVGANQEEPYILM